MSPIQTDNNKKCIKRQRERERDREREKERERETDRQTERQTGREREDVSLTAKITYARRHEQRCN